MWLPMCAWLHIHVLVCVRCPCIARLGNNCARLQYLMDSSFILVWLLFRNSNRSWPMRRESTSPRTHGPASSTMLTWPTMPSNVCVHARMCLCANFVYACVHVCAFVRACLFACVPLCAFVCLCAKIHVRAKKCGMCMLWLWCCVHTHRTFLQCASRSDVPF